MNPEQEIIFVYNADSNVFSMVTDYLHKKISPDTYKCNLCKITYGVTMDNDWKEYVQSLPYKVSFLHKDELLKQYPELANTELPSVFIRDESGMNVIVSREELNQPKNVGELIALMKEKFKI
ncbi:hypothetical protein ACFL3C_04210 [Patescibacteria group bacterium]